MKRLYIVSIETNERVEEIEVQSERNHESVLCGLLLRIDTERYFVDDSEFDEAEIEGKMICPLVVSGECRDPCGNHGGSHDHGFWCDDGDCYSLNQRITCVLYREETKEKDENL